MLCRQAKGGAQGLRGRQCRHSDTAVAGFDGTAEGFQQCLAVPHGESLLPRLCCSRLAHGCRYMTFALSSLYTWQSNMQSIQYRIYTARHVVSTHIAYRAYTLLTFHMCSRLYLMALCVRPWLILYRGLIHAHTLRPVP